MPDITVHTIRQAAWWRRLAWMEVRNIDDPLGRANASTLLEVHSQKVNQSIYGVSLYSWLGWPFLR